MTLERIQALGCIVCHQEGVFTPAELHHPTSGGRRIHKNHVIPLCPPHHRLPGKGYLTRHGSKRAFIKAYGTEDELHAKMLKLYEQVYGEPV